MAHAAGVVCGSSVGTNSCPSSIPHAMPIASNASAPTAQQYVLASTRYRGPPRCGGQQGLSWRCGSHRDELWPPPISQVPKCPGKPKYPRTSCDDVRLRCFRCAHASQDQFTNQAYPTVQSHPEAPETLPSTTNENQRCASPARSSCRVSHPQTPYCRPALHSRFFFLPSLTLTIHTGRRAPCRRWARAPSSEAPPG